MTLLNLDLDVRISFKGPVNGYSRDEQIAEAIRIIQDGINKHPFCLFRNVIRTDSSKIVDEATSGY